VLFAPIIFFLRTISLSLSDALTSLTHWLTPTNHLCSQTCCGLFLFLEAVLDSLQYCARG
jgi:hypothetical protein